MRSDVPTRCPALVIPFLGLALLVPSSSISAEESPPDGEEGSPVEIVTPPIAQADVTPVTVAEIRETIERGALDRALELVRRRIALTDDEESPAEMRILEARVLDRLGMEWEATRVYRRVLEDDELGALALSELHDLYLRSGRFEAANRLTEDADPARLGLRARALEVRGRYSEAVRVASDPTLAGDAPAAIVRANSRLALGDIEAAEQEYVEVLGVARDARVRQAAHFGLGQVARLQGGRAARVLQDERAARLGPAPAAGLDRGLALRSLGRRQEAREQLMQTAEDWPALAASARLALARLDETEGEVEAGLEQLAASLEGSAGDFLAWTRIGELLLQGGREEEGIEALRRALILLPGFPPALERWTRALATQGRWEEASANDPVVADWDLPGWTWERLLEGDLPFHEIVADRDSLADGDPRRVVLALVQLRAGSPAGTLAWTEGATATDGVLVTLRAEALESVGRDREARDLWREILDANPEADPARERLARLVYPVDPDEAERLWADLFRGAPGQNRARLRMARILEEDGRLEEARSAYEAALESGWLSRSERRRIRVAIDDLEYLVREQAEARLDD